jgi:hypothetical protein
MPATRRFQAVFFLSFATDGSDGIDGLVVDKSACKLTVTFAPFDYDALHASPLSSATLSASKDKQAVIVKLDGSRQILGVSLHSGAAVDLYRADGLIQADKPAVSDGFTDVNFAVRPADQSAIAVSDMASVRVRGIPGNVQLFIASPDPHSADLKSPQLTSPVMFWPASNTAGQMNVDASLLFANALQAFLDAQRSALLKQKQTNPAASLPNPIVAALVVQSDSPASAVITEFRAAYRCLLQSFSSGTSDKQVLRYSGKLVDTQQVSIQLPHTAKVFSGTIRINESFRPGRPAPVNDALGNAPIVQDRGLRISAAATQTAGQFFNPSDAVSVQSIALGMMALAPDAQISVEIQADWQGKPSGRKIGSGSATLKQTGRRQWIIVAFKDTLPVPSKPHWILVSAIKGDSIWLVEAGTHSAGLLEFRAGAWSETASLQGYKALYRLLQPPSTDQNSGNSAPAPAVHLNIGATVVQGNVLKDENQKYIGRLFDVAQAMNTFLAAARSGESTPSKIEVPVIFTSGSAGLITVYAPELAYETT